MISILTIIIPAYNEEKTINQILDKLLAANLNNIQKEIIIVNDCLTDQTQIIVEEYIKEHPSENIRLINQLKNNGKGAALHKGITNTTGEYLVIQDADLEYDPSEFNDLLQPVFKAGADAVYGSRFMGSNPHRILFFWHTIGNKFLTLLSIVVRLRFKNHFSGS